MTSGYPGIHTGFYREGRIDFHITTSTAPLGKVGVGFVYQGNNNGSISRNYTLQSAKVANKDALISYNPLCSKSPQEYKMAINIWSNDLYNWRTNSFPFEILSASGKKANPWAYDLILSPAILNVDARNMTATSTARPNDIRIVTRWIKGGNFFAGALATVVKPKLKKAQVFKKADGSLYNFSDLEDSGWLQQIHDDIENTWPPIAGSNSQGDLGDLKRYLRRYFGKLPPPLDADEKEIMTVWISHYSTTSVATAFEGLTLGETTGINYYKKNSTPAYGFYYHDHGFTPDNSNVESYTVDISKLSGLEHAFYVRYIPSGTNEQGIQDKQGVKLMVEVYLPVADSARRGFRHFDTKPANTFYLDTALNSASDISANVTAEYWHVFNIRRSSIGSISGAGISNIIKVGAKQNGEIVTDIKQVKY